MSRPESLNAILHELRERMPELRERYHVRNLSVFGSWVHGEQTADSDLDMLVEYDSTPGLIEFVELQDYLSDMLGIQVDLGMVDALKGRIGRNIAAEKVMV